ncbi:uncharacterized protein LTR77_009406 [Saxophila tyrrhenica]|uniref:FAD-binding domain-containing protein n=1 Tax=Saxophila tyrrhenica TaxID=1690608 RepID=A0AAV9NXK2_9PEZI|nr:hypothetical protein LTR77_009406 [Saxophila tyrrhenica]
MESQPDFKVLIVGAGICGLLIAQGLKKHGIAFEIFEQESTAGRSRDWGMAYFWSADYLPYLLPQELVDRLPEVQVDPFYKAQPVESMTVTNGLDGSAIKVVPSPGGRRVGRKATRRLMAEGIDIKFNHRLKSISYPTASTVEVSFENGTKASGNVLIGADGGGSRVRRSLLGSLAEPKPLPIYMVNFNARYRNPDHAVFIRSNLRHFVDHGVHPKGMFFLMTLQSVPDPKKPETWSFQITITWPPELSPNKQDPEPPHTLQDLQALTKDWASPKREAIDWLCDSDVTVTDGFFSKNGTHSTTAAVEETDPWQLVIPSDRVSIWLPVLWDNHEGRVTLAGDAAHAMTFHRGQGLNNCIRDAKEIVSGLKKHVKGETALSGVVAAYEKEMLDRGSAEVKTSMEQTLKCHNWEKFQHSPVMKIGGSPIRHVENTEWKKILAEQAMEA